MEKFISVIAPTRYVVDVEAGCDGTDKDKLFQWWNSNVSTIESKVPLECEDCKHVLNATIHNFMQKKATKCECVHKMWKFKYDYVVDLLMSRGYALVHPFNNRDYWVSNVTVTTNLTTVCCECSCVATTCKPNSLDNGTFPRCLCKHKTQKMVFQFVKDTVFLMNSSMKVVAEFKDVWNDAVSNMKYDIAVVSGDDAPLLFIEVDGMQHFETLHFFQRASQSFREQRFRDVEKECDAIFHGAPLLRLSQQDVWESKFEWKEYVKSMLSMALNMELKPMLYLQPGCQLYASNDFVRDREDVGLKMRHT